MDIYQEPNPIPFAVDRTPAQVEKELDKYGATRAAKRKLIETGSVVIGKVEIRVEPSLPF